MGKIVDKHSPDEMLMEALGRRDRKAFELLYDRYFSKLVYFSKRFFDNDEQKAEDIVQDIFIKLIDRPAMFDTSRTFSTWVYTLARNACLDLQRKESNRSNLLKQQTPLKQHAEMHTTIDYQNLKTKLNNIYNTLLSEKEKMIFILRFEHHMNIKEIAEIAGIPEGSVKSGLFYLLKKIASQINEFEYGKQA